MKRDLSALAGALAIAAALAVPALAVAAEPATPAGATTQFPDKLTEAGKQFIDQCSDDTLAASPDPLVASARCQSLYRQWYSQAGEPLPRQYRSGILKSNIPFHSSVMMPVTRAL